MIDTVLPFSRVVAVSFLPDGFTMTLLWSNRILMTLPPAVCTTTPLLVAVSTVPTSVKLPKFTLGPYVLLVFGVARSADGSFWLASVFAALPESLCVPTWNEISVSAANMSAKNATIVMMNVVPGRRSLIKCASSCALHLFVGGNGSISRVGR
jgi:hypothetical protein